MYGFDSRTNFSRSAPTPQEDISDPNERTAQILFYFDRLGETLKNIKLTVRSLYSHCDDLSLVDVQTVVHEPKKVTLITRAVMSVFLLGEEDLRTEIENLERN